jgi:site-specific DNA-methyltransferase (adenine-specific)
LPHQVTIDADRFMDATIDLWEMPPESATRVGHPAPFPVGLPQALIDLYTYEGDLVLDPFMGSGTTAVAAVRTHRHYIGFDTDEGYVRDARVRCEAEVEARYQREAEGRVRVRLPVDAAAAEPAVVRSQREGKKAKDVAIVLLEQCGFREVVADRKLFTGATIDLAARDANGDEWFFDVPPAFTSVRNGLRRTDMVWKALGKAALTDDATPYVLLTIDRPGRASAGERALREALGRGIVFDALELYDGGTIERLTQYAAQGRAASPPRRLFGD